MNMKRNTKKENTPANQAALHGGVYSLSITAVVVALMIVLNLMAEALPKSMTQYDISASKLYSVTSNTKMVLNNLEDDVTIYWIVQAGEEDAILSNLLNKYDSLSDHVTVVKKNPDAFPTFAEQYTDEPVQNNSLVVECGERSRFISFYDIYLSDTGIDGVGHAAEFDGEGAITSAIDYVVNEEHPIVYLLEGHGEDPLPDKFTDQIKKANMDIFTMSLLNTDEIPEDAACVMIYAPASDFSQEEIEILDRYVKDGGKMFVAAGPTKDGMLTNLYSLLEPYGVETVDGVVVEADRGHYAFREPYVLMPMMDGGELTQPLLEERYYPIVPIAQGLQIVEPPSSVQVTPLLSTSPLSFSKAAGFKLDTYEKEPGDTDGPFAIAVDIQTEQDGRIVWFSSSVFLNDLYNAYSSGANTNLAMNALSSVVGETEAMAIRSKSLSYDYLTISESTATLLKAVMIGLFPLVYLGIGVTVVVMRRRKRHESI